MEALDRLLALVCRELGASRAWVEYGSAPPPEQAVASTIRDGWRLCASVEAPTAEARELLDELATSFDRVLCDAVADAPAPPQPSEAGETLRQTLDVLVERIGAQAAWVIDERSPVVWGASSHGRWLADVDRARSIGHALGDHEPSEVIGWMQGQQLPPPPAELVAHLPTIAAATKTVPAARLLVTWAAIAQASSQPGTWTWNRDPLHVMVRPFAAIYRVLALFDAPFSPLHAETTLSRAVPVLERLVTDHPPVDPTPKGARIHAFVPRGR